MRFVIDIGLGVKHNSRLAENRGEETSVNKLVPCPSQAGSIASTSKQTTRFENVAFNVAVNVYARMRAYMRVWWWWRRNGEEGDEEQ